MKSPEILTQNRPKYMKLPEILTPYTNRGASAPPTYAYEGDIDKVELHLTTALRIISLGYEI